MVRGASALGPPEVIPSQIAPLARALAMIDSGEISDGKTIAALDKELRDRHEPAPGAGAEPSEAGEPPESGEPKA